MQHATPTAIAPIRVFLADDSALSRRRVAEMLAAQGLVVAGQAGTPEAAIAGILASRPDVVVLDVQFREGTGMQVLRAVLRASPRTPFIILSNHAEPAYRARYLAQGAACFLDKHAEFYQLAGQVKAAAGRTDPGAFSSASSSASSQSMEPSCH